MGKFLVHVSTQKLLLCLPELRTIAISLDYLSRFNPKVS